MVDQMDVRVRQRLLDKGRLSHDPVHKYLVDLKDTADNAAWIDYESRFEQEKAEAAAQEGVQNALGQPAIEPPPIAPPPAAPQAGAPPPPPAAPQALSEPRIPPAAPQAMPEPSPYRFGGSGTPDSDS